MNQIHVHEFISLDGRFDDPSFTMAHGFDEQMGTDLEVITSGASGILLGRTTHEMFAPAWRDRTTADDPGADFFNLTTKYVVGATEPAEPWNATQRIGPYDPAVIVDLKKSQAGDLYISGSGQLVRGLLDDGLIDHLHLFVYPVVLGVGERLLDRRVDLTLLASRAYANGVVHLDYGPA